MENKRYVQSVSRILIVDDDAEIRNFLTNILRKYTHHQTQVAINGEDAISKWVEADPPFDIMIIDLKMPRMDGETLIKNIRKKDHGIGIAEHT